MVLMKLLLLLNSAAVAADDDDGYDEVSSLWISCYYCQILQVPPLSSASTSLFKLNGRNRRPWTD